LGGKIEGEVQRGQKSGRRGRQQQDDFKEKRGYNKLKEEKLDRPLWKTRFEIS
jgi:hypothetical protein